MRTKLIISFLILVVINALVTSWVGVRLIGDEIVRQAQDKVQIDINSARETYLDKLDEVQAAVRLVAVKCALREALLTGYMDPMKDELRVARQKEGLDILSIADKNGVVLFRARNPGVFGDSQAGDDVVGAAIARSSEAAGTEIVTRRELLKEGKDLADRARMKLVATPMARPRPETEETSGMVMKAAACIVDQDGSIAGVLYGAKLLNQSSDIVDKVRDIVYRGETYKGRDVGTVTLFQGDLRISTNVITTEGTRAVGTRVSEEVYDQVIQKGVPWFGRAFVVNEWHISAYEPIRNLKGRVIGMLYVGTLEAPYVDLRNRVVYTFLLIALSTAAVLFMIGYFITMNIVRPVKALLFATRKVAAGDLTYRVPTKSHDEVGELTVSFNKMTSELEKATQSNLALTRILEDKIKDKTEELEEAQDQLVRSEKLSSLGRMAAGIAHEINNPLTSILINSHLMEERLQTGEACAENLKLIMDETSRCSTIVKGLLEFSRQTAPRKGPANLNEVVSRTLTLMRSQILLHRVNVDLELDQELPEIMVDTNKIAQVFTNIILNAIDAMRDGGTLTIASRMSPGRHFVEVEFGDTGCGIAKEHIGRIFDPFYTTKGTKGTGLGLAVSYGIIEQHGGEIRVHSEVGKGAVFTVQLPAHSGTVAPGEDRARPR
ncbi:MAG: cache domain-containing protein [Candidatus Eisenbacteria bacterium]|nr:cache domain-containing protein [Candidatus Eisenbacteria bacterium]